MKLRHQKVADGAVMAQIDCAAINRCPKGKAMAQCARHLAYPNGAPMAQWRTGKAGEA